MDQKPVDPDEELLPAIDERPHSAKPNSARSRWPKPLFGAAGAVLVITSGVLFLRGLPADPAQELAQLSSGLNQMQMTLAQISLEQSALTAVDATHDQQLSELAKAVLELKQSVIQLQAGLGAVTTEVPEQLSAFEKKLHAQGLANATMEQRMAVLEKLSRQAAARNAGPARGTAAPATGTVVKAKARQPKARPAPTPSAPPPPAIRLENIDSFGGKHFAVVIQQGTRRFLAREDVVDGRRLQQLTNTGARFTHVQTGAVMQLNRPN